MNRKLGGVMFSLEGIGDKIRNNNLGIAMTAFLTASSLIGVAAHAQSEQPVSSQSYSMDASKPAQNSAPAQSQEFTLNTNPLNIPDSHWNRMAGFIKQVKTMGRPPPVQMTPYVPEAYIELLKRTKQRPFEGRELNLTAMDHYVELMGRRAGQLGIFVGVIDDGGVNLNFEKRLREIRNSLQSIVDYNYEKTGAWITQVVKVVPHELEELCLTEEQKEGGFVVYSRGVRHSYIPPNGENPSPPEGCLNHENPDVRSLSYIGTGVYPRDVVAANRPYQDIRAIFGLQILGMNNKEYASYIMRRSKDAQNLGLTDGSSSDSGEQAESAEPVALNLEQ